MNLKFSVITPSYNQGMFLEETIDSVLSQNYPNLEYIIIDGGSSDNSVDIIKKYQKHLKFWVSEKDRGHWDALNKGFSHATGDILSWINSDDRYFPWTFSTVADVFSQNQDISWLTGLTTVIDEKSRITGVYKVRKDMDDFLTHNFDWIQQESTFWRKSLWDKAGGSITTNHKFMVDGELWSRFFGLTQMWHVDLTLGAYRIHGTNRAIVFKKEVMDEMYSIVANLRKEVGPGKVTRAYLLKVARKLSRSLNYFRIHPRFEALGSYKVLKQDKDLWIPDREIK
jgi:glycosyltransferase involved in cell wall biosynthesis